MVPDLTHRRRMLVLAICCSSLFIVGLDVTIVNLALPSIRDDLGSSLSGLQWVIDAYTLVLASLLMLGGSTGDRIGRRRTFQAGLVLFGAGSLLCSLASTTGWLVAFRALQAVGGSMLNPVAMSIITNVFTDRAERARAIGVWGSVIGLSMALGPLLGGALVGAVGWRSVFWMNVPVVVAVVVLTARFVPESRAPRARRFDASGQLLMIVLLAGVTFGIIEGPVHGWGSPLIVGSFAAAGAALVALLVVESRRAEPLLDPRFFASVPFSAATLIAVAAFAALAGFLFLNSLYLQDVRGYSPLHAGLLTLPMAAMTVLLPPISGRIVATRGTRLPLLVGGAGIAGERCPAAQPGRRHPAAPARRRVRGVRRRLRHGQRADHEHGGVRDAGDAGRGGRGGRVDQPAGRLRARRGGAGFAGHRAARRVDHGGFCGGCPARLDRGDRVRPGGAGPGPGRAPRPGLGRRPGGRPSGSRSRFPRRPGLRRAERALGSAARSGTARLTPE